MAPGFSAVTPSRRTDTLTDIDARDRRMQKLRAIAVPRSGV
jgi:hypothetical protein